MVQRDRGRMRTRARALSQAIQKDCAKHLPRTRGDVETKTGILRLLEEKRTARSSCVVLVLTRQICRAWLEQIDRVPSLRPRRNVNSG